MIDREELIKELMKQTEDEFFKENGFIMNSKQKKIVRKKAEKMVDRRLKSINNLSF